VVFHLACYHGNQSSIADPMADHENNTMTTLKLFEWLHHFQHVKKVVYAAAGCAMAEKNFDDATATPEEGRAPCSTIAPARFPADRRDVGQPLLDALPDKPGNIRRCMEKHDVMMRQMTRNELPSHKLTAKMFDPCRD